jgi:hypothetical protein
MSIKMLKKMGATLKNLSLRWAVWWNQVLLAIDDWLILRRVAAIKTAEKRAGKAIERSTRRLVKLRLAQANAMADASMAAVTPRRRPTTCAIRVIGPSI